MDLLGTYTTVAISYSTWYNNKCTYIYNINQSVKEATCIWNEIRIVKGSCMTARWMCFLVAVTCI